jgi:hypothetical protein
MCMLCMYIRACVCMHVYTCMCIRVCACMRVCVVIGKGPLELLWLRARIDAASALVSCQGTYIYMHVSVKIYIYIYIYICIHTYILHTCNHPYIQNHTHRFGAHQVILVRTQDAKKDIPKEFENCLVMTVAESKGLEFDDVFLW